MDENSTPSGPVSILDAALRVADRGLRPYPPLLFGAIVDAVLAGIATASQDAPWSCCCRRSLASAPCHWASG